jgi:hypothetical protein
MANAARGTLRRRLLLLFRELLPDSSNTVLIKNSLQLISNIRGITVLDITALHHVDKLPFSK